MSPPLISLRVPYLPLKVRFGQSSSSFEALLDTGFEGDVIVPERMVADSGVAGTMG